jgi:hypothetical protein
MEGKRSNENRKADVDEESVDEAVVDEASAWLGTNTWNRWGSERET